MTTAFEIFIFGLASSLHCAGMCGPLAACSAAGGWVATSFYHGARVVSYSAVGAAAGGLGSVLGQHVDSGTLGAITAWISTGLGIALLALGLGWGAWLSGVGSAAGTQPMVVRVLRRVLSLGPAARAVSLGLLTPLLPCGVLWIVFARAFITAHPIDGAATLSWFAFGAVPALLLVQVNLGWWNTRLSPRARGWVFRALMAIAGSVLVYRGLAALTGTGSCCH